MDKGDMEIRCISIKIVEMILQIMRFFVFKILDIRIYKIGSLFVHVLVIVYIMKRFTKYKKVIKKNRKIFFKYIGE